MKVTKKQLKLIGFFAIIHFFMPFALVKCGGEDIPFIVDPSGDETADETADCDSNEFLTKACADKLEEDSKKAADAAAQDTSTDPEPAADDSTTEDPAPTDDEAAAPAAALSGGLKIHLNQDITPHRDDLLNIDLSAAKNKIQKNFY